MKTFIVEHNSGDSTTPLHWYFIPDSALSNTGKPLFMPEGCDVLTAYIAPAIRFSRLGKCIGARFAGRYFNEWLPGIHFRDNKLRCSLLSQGLPPDMSHAFDRSLFLGKPLGIDSLTAATPLILHLNGEPTATLNINDFPVSIEEATEAVSAQNTIKTGDILVPMLSEGVDVRIGDFIELKAGTDTLFSIAIK